LRSIGETAPLVVFDQPVVEPTLQFELAEHELCVDGPVTGPFSANVIGVCDHDKTLLTASIF
jgi:hypothetical protein